MCSTISMQIEGDLRPPSHLLVACWPRECGGICDSVTCPDLGCPT